MIIEDLETLRDGLAIKSKAIQTINTTIQGKISEIEKKMIQYLTSVERNSIEFAFHHKWWRYEISLRLIDKIDDPEHINNTNKRLLIVISKRDVSNHIIFDAKEYHDLRAIPKPEILVRIIDKTIEYIKKHVKELEKEAKELEIEYEDLTELSDKIEFGLEKFNKIEKSFLERTSFLSSIRKKKEDNEEPNKN